MTFQIERLEFEEFCVFLRFQAEEAFPNLKNEERLMMLAEKWSSNAECSTCRNDDGQLIGMIAFYSNGQGAEFAYIPHVYVSQMYRHQGVFTRMLKMVKEHVKQKGFTTIRLEVNKNNMQAQNAYLRNGFYFLPNNSERRNSIYMVLHIS